MRMNADGKHCRSSTFIGVHLRPELIFSQPLAILSIISEKCRLRHAWANQFNIDKSA
jgi:hypothetical protein